MTHKPSIYLFVSALIATLLPAMRADENDDLLLHLMYHNALESGPGLLRQAFDTVQSMHASKEQMNAEIAQARKAFWDAYPNGKEISDLARHYAQALLVKDFIYLQFRGTEFYAQKKLGDNRGLPTALGKIGGELDGGITAGGFQDWVEKVVSAGSKGSLVMNWAQGLADPEAQKAYENYRRLRDVDEYLRYCPTSPKQGSDSRKYFQYLYLLGSDDASASLDKADAAYQKLVKILGKDLVQKALDRAKTLTNTSDTVQYRSPLNPARANTTGKRFQEGFYLFMKCLNREVEASNVDHLFLLAFLKPVMSGDEDKGSFADVYAAGETRYQDLLRQMGEAKLSAAAQKMRAKLVAVRERSDAWDLKNGSHQIDPLAVLNRAQLDMVLLEGRELFPQRFP